ncbi:MAG: twin-arginine translocation signal domain-containing protein [Chloroflexi bacterium]|nr:MAG: twin-arginine translocation signal domain-containing protein [Chloroflexota bacterium]
MLSRREFLKLSGAGTLALFAATNGKFLQRVVAQIPGGTLDPLSVPKYMTPLLIPPAMPKAAKIRLRRKDIDYYVIAMRQFEQQILPAGMPATTVWGYGPRVAQKGPKIFNAPSLTIEARHKTEVRIMWINELVDAKGKYLPHLLPVDPTLHWANPSGGTAGRDTRPTFTSTPGPYTGPVPIVSHVHGAVGVGDESDGHAEAWYLPAARNIPRGYARQGTWYEHFRKKALKEHLAVWLPGSATSMYPNENRASTIWYHDHTLGMTRVNVYAGPAGFYIVRGGPAGDEAVTDSRSGAQAVLPGPAPKERDPFPPNKTYYEIPIAIQDRAFNNDGSLFYPNTREFFDGYIGPCIPETDISPIWNPEFFGNMIMVNGNTWPFQTVEKRRYRLRFLDGCQARFLILDFSNIPGVEVWQIGNEGGFLSAPVNLSADHGNRLLMSPAERADVIVDFTNVEPGNYVLGNVGPDEPFGGGEPGMDFDLADPATTGQIMEFRVIPAAAPDPTTPPQFLQLPAIEPLPAETMTRPLALMEMMSMVHDGPAEAMLGNVDEMGMPMHQMWSDPITENPMVGDTEVWEFYNFTADAHPMHVHEVVFEVVNREGLVLDAGEPVQPVQLSGIVRPPEAWESGFKDTVTAYPGEVTRIRAKFDKPGTFVWHCHIVEHEDNEMMRPYRIGPADPNAPGDGM